MLNNWFIYTISATIIYGIINFIYKIAAVHKCPSHQIVNISATTISVLSLIIILLTKSEFLNFKQILLFAIINSAFFGLGSIVKIQSLKLIPSSFAFPITKLNAVFLIIYALIIFNDKPTWNQWIGIGISLSMLVFISLSIKKENKTGSFDKKKQIIGLLLALLAAFSTSISMLTGKFASTEVPKLNYIFVSYSLVMIYTFIINKTIYRKKQIKNKKMNKKILIFGFAIGILNFSGYYLILSAFATGKLSLIQGISSNSFIIPIILSIIIFKEKFNYKNAIVLILAILSIILIKIKI